MLTGLFQENDSGELELDIDMLSNDCLVKLWQLCKKAMPSFGLSKAAQATAAASAAESSPAGNSVTKQASSKSSKPKKNKPMSAREQEERIAELKGIREMWKKGQNGPDPQAALQDIEDRRAGGDSSEDSDSEEE
jgi:bromodomain-containing factor 1